MYGWTPCVCLAMPASRFFSVLVAGKRIKFAEEQMRLASLCDISAISLANPKYYETVRGGFIKAARSAYAPDVLLKEPENNGIEAGSDAARDAMFAAVYAMKGGPRG